MLRGVNNRNPDAIKAGQVVAAETQTEGSARNVKRMNTNPSRKPVTQTRHANHYVRLNPFDPNRLIPALQRQTRAFRALSWMMFYGKSRAAEVSEKLTMQQSTLVIVGVRSRRDSRELAHRRSGKRDGQRR